MSMTIEERVKRIVSEQMCVPESTLEDATTFSGDLGTDSLDEVELVVEFEHEFGIEISDEDATQVKTIRQAIDYLTRATT